MESGTRIDNESVSEKFSWWPIVGHIFDPGNRNRTNQIKVYPTSEPAGKTTYLFYGYMKSVLFCGLAEPGET